MSTGRLVVYGSTLTAYSCLHYLLEVVGLAGERITLVLPPSDPSCFNNPTVEKQVQQALSTTGEQHSMNTHHIISITVFENIMFVTFASYKILHSRLSLFVPIGVEVLDGYRVVCYNPGGESNGSDLHSVQLASSSDTTTVNCRVCAVTNINH